MGSAEISATRNATGDFFKNQPFGSVIFFLPLMSFPLAMFVLRSIFSLSLPFCVFFTHKLLSALKILHNCTQEMRWSVSSQKCWQTVDIWFQDIWTSRFCWSRGGGERGNKRGAHKMKTMGWDHLWTWDAESWVCSSDLSVGLFLKMQMCVGLK